MILYNVTVSIDARIHEEWLDWMKTKHIPGVMATGCFIESRLSRIHGEEGELSFAISYLCKTQEEYDTYIREYAVELQQEHAQKFTDKFAAFRTMLTVLEEFSA